MTVGTDVEMKDSAAQQPQQAATPTPQEVSALLVSDLNNYVNLVARGVVQKDDRLLSRALRQSLALRKKLDANILQKIVNTILVSSPRKDVFEKYLPDVMEADSIPTPTPLTPFTTQFPNFPQAPLPEIETLVQLLLVVWLIDSKKYSDAAECSADLVQYIQNFNRRSLDLFAARAYFYYSRSHELNNQLADIRGTLLAALRTASLRHDNLGQTVLLNLLLRNYLKYNLYDQAEKLVSKTVLPDSRSNNNQLARYYYYLGRIKCVQLDYSEAYSHLMQAKRKAPTTSALGFRIAVNKLLVIVQLLIGEIPDRSIFRQSGLKKALKPYLQLTQTVRVGDLSAFRNVVERFGDGFKTDNTYTLIQRIRQNVIKTGLKKISVSYSRISLADICTKLHLDTAEDAEGIVAKAIRDGVIDAVIDHDAGFVQSKETVDIYSTNEPSQAFHKRIAFCLNLHNEAVKAMRFPDSDAMRREHDLEMEDERRKRQQELAEELANGEDYDDGDDF